MRRAMGRIFGHPLVVSFLVAAALAAGCLAIWQYWTKNLLRQGEQALAIREYAKASEHLSRYLAARPGDAHARLDRKSVV